MEPTVDPQTATAGIRIDQSLGIAAGQEGPLFKFTGRLRDLVTAAENDSKCTDPIIRSEAAHRHRRVGSRQRAPSRPVTPAYWRYASA